LFHRSRWCHESSYSNIWLIMMIQIRRFMTIYVRKCVASWHHRRAAPACWFNSPSYITRHAWPENQFTPLDREPRSDVGRLRKAKWIILHAQCHHSPA
jgi:hypothetical protein